MNPQDPINAEAQAYAHPIAAFFHVFFKVCVQECFEEMSHAIQILIASLSTNTDWRARCVCALQLSLS